ncbi:peptidoglycan-binding domain-containing protein [Jannaschia formosa]|uniref:peptidoglycan-binding domain-containing protein n=1 Tax=Jannaschia formosa TaxID=2259592 RepID=UPI00142F4066|nr:peptidoglycan-binding domain-containing protein [Jannaschia formosa]
MARLSLLLTLPVLWGCAPAPAGDVTRASGLPAPAISTCQAEGITPAVLETVTEQAVEVPAMTAPDGTVLRPAQFRSVTSTRIVTPREITRFETPCALQRRDPDFVMQVQRALQVRGLYDGPVSGDYDRATQAAVAAFQAEEALESAELSTASAQRLGLVVLGRDA